MFLFLKIVLVLANSADPDEISSGFSRCKSTHLGVSGLHRINKEPFNTLVNICKRVEEKLFKLHSNTLYMYMYFAHKSSSKSVFFVSSNGPGKTSQAHRTLCCLHILYYSKTCLKRPLKKNTKIGFQDRLSLNTG